MFSLQTTNEQEAVTRYREAKIMDAARQTAESIPISKAPALYHRHRKVSGAHNSEHTRRLYETVVNKWVSMYGDNLMHEVTPAMAEAFAEHLYENTAQNTQGVYIAVMKALFTHFEKKMMVPRSPFRNIEKPKSVPSSRSKRFLTASERDMLIDSSTDRLKTFFILGFHCGMRISEIVEARHSWIRYHQGKGSITIQATPTFRVKNGKQHTVPLNRIAMTHLKRISGRPDDYIIAPHRKKNSGRYRYLPLRSIKAHAERCGIHDFHTHIMRHSFVTYYFNKGVSLDKIARWIGDTISQVEKTYSHLIPWDDDDINL